MNLEPLLKHVEPTGGLPPVETWHPERVGEMDLEIAADGRWFHEGGEMTRPALVRLLSTLLRREADGHYYLVTPAEKQRIRVVDRPFLIVDAERDGDGDWWLTTNAGDRLRLDAARSLTPSATPEGEEIPEVPVRLGLTARLGRNVYYRLVEEAEQRPGRPGWVELGLFSGDTWQPLGSVPAEAL